MAIAFALAAIAGTVVAVAEVAADRFAVAGTAAVSAFPFADRIAAVEAAAFPVLVPVAVVPVAADEGRARSVEFDRCSRRQR